MKAYGVARGLLLEDRGVRLPWGATPDELRRIEPPALETPAGPNGVRLYWRGGRCFGGLSVVCVSTEFGAAGWPQDKLRGLRVVFAADGGPGGAAQEFARGQEELARRFGTPASVRVGEWEGAAEWRLGEVVLRHEFFDGWGTERCVYLFLDE